MSGSRGLERAQQVESGEVRVEVDVGDDQVEAPPQAGQRLFRGLRVSISRSASCGSSCMKRQVSRSSSTTRMRDNQLPSAERRQVHDRRRALAGPGSPGARYLPGPRRSRAGSRSPEARALPERLGGEQRLEHACMRSSPWMPAPESVTTSATPSSSRRAPSVRRPPGPASASTAFVTRLSRACSSCTRSTSTAGSPGSTSKPQVHAAAHQRRANQVGQPDDDVAGGQRPQLQRGPARLVEQRLHDPGHARDLLLHGAQPLGVGRGVGLLGAQELDVARDHVEGRTHLVRDRRRPSGPPAPCAGSAPARGARQNRRCAASSERAGWTRAAPRSRVRPRTAASR